MRVVAVVNGPGSAGPLEVVQAAAGWCAPVLVDSSAQPEGRATLRTLSDLLPCVDLAAGGVPAAADELALLGVEGITTFSDDRLAVTAQLAARLGLPYHDMGAAAALRGKDEQRARLNTAGVSTTRFAVITGPGDVAKAVDTVGLPAVLKPVASSGSAFTCRVDSPDDIARELASAGCRPELAVPAAVRTAAEAPRQLEELFAGAGHPAGDWLGDYVSVETLTLGPGEHRHLCVTDRLPVAYPLRETGLLLPSLLPAQTQAEVCALARRALDAVDVHIGLSHVEIKLTPTGPRVLEVNGRLGGFVPYLLRLVSDGDVDVVRLALASAAGVPVDRVPDRFAGVALTYLVHAPAHARSVRRLADPRELTSIAGVRRVERHVEPGAPTDFRVGTHGRLQTVWLCAETAEALRAAKEQVDTVLAAGNAFD
jgi:biotin carboxylase